MIHQAFLLGEAWWADATSAPEGTARADDRIASFAARQWVDLFSPPNTPWLNAEVIDATGAEGGRNLLGGLMSGLDDLQLALGGTRGRRVGSWSGETSPSRPGRWSSAMS